MISFQEFVRVMCRVLDPQSAQQYARECFSRMDYNNDGQLTLQEIRSAYKNYHRDCRQQQVAPQMGGLNGYQSNQWGENPAYMNAGNEYSLQLYQDEYNNYVDNEGNIVDEYGNIVQFGAYAGNGSGSCSGSFTSGSGAGASMYMYRRGVPLRRTTRTVFVRGIGRNRMGRRMYRGTRPQHRICAHRQVNIRSQGFRGPRGHAMRGYGHGGGAQRMGG